MFIVCTRPWRGLARLSGSLGSVSRGCFLSNEEFDDPGVVFPTCVHERGHAGTVPNVHANVVDFEVVPDLFRVIAAILDGRENRVFLYLSFRLLHILHLVSLLGIA